MYDIYILGYVSGIMRVEGLAETTEIAVDAVESQSSTWCFLREGSQDSSGENFLGGRDARWEFSGGGGEAVFTPRSK